VTGRRVLFGSVAVLALFLVVGRWSASLYTEHLWYRSLGANDVWRAKTATIAVLTLSSFAVASLFAFANLYAVRQSVVSLVLPRRMANIEIGEEVPGRYLLIAVGLLSVLIGALLTFPSDQWHTALLASGGRPFGETDSYFGADLGFFVYWLPFETAVYYWAIVVLAVITAIVVALYALTPSLRWDRGSLYVSAYVRRHFMLLGAVLLLLLSWSYRLSMYRLLASGGTSGALSMVDQRINIPAALVLSVVSVCAAFMVARAGWVGQMRLAFFAVSAVIVLSLVSRTIAPLFLRRSMSSAARTSEEYKYMGTRVIYTRRAYGIYRMRAESLGTGFASPAEASTRLAIWDGATLARAAEHLRNVKVVGDAPAWQATPTGIAALFVEHSLEGTLDRRDVWGIGRFDAATADENGLPERNPPPAMASDELVIGEPIVYDSAPEYSILSDSLHQIAGVEMVSTSSRLLHAWSLQNFRLLFGELPANRPKIVRRRAIRDRLAALAPFFEQGSEVVPVIANDSLYWVVELYAASSTYPLANRYAVLGEERGYFQHAATALVHATSGRVRLILDMNPEPVTLSWVAIFPRLFTPPSAVSPAIRAMLPPITDGAHTQALAFASVGFPSDNLEIRHFAAPDGADSSASREPVHAVIPAVGGVSSLWPLLDSAERVRGVVVASGGPARVTSWIPIAGDANRWGSVVDRLRSADSSLRETGIVRAPIRAAPLAGRVLYAQPSFQLRSGASPKLVRVSVVLGDSVRTGPTLSLALGAPVANRPNEIGVARDARLRPDSLYRAMRAALGKGDWAAFGRALDALGVALGVTGR
jgi:hypothetical protein